MNGMTATCYRSSSLLCRRIFEVVSNRPVPKAKQNMLFGIVLRKYTCFTERLTECCVEGHVHLLCDRYAPRRTSTAVVP